MLIPGGRSRQKTNQKIFVLRHQQAGRGKINRTSPRPTWGYAALSSFSSSILALAFQSRPSTNRRKLYLKKFRPDPIIEEIQRSTPIRNRSCFDHQSAITDKDLFAGGCAAPRKAEEAERLGRSDLEQFLAPASIKRRVPDVN
jgi:hypothetical protein